jgi:hypothetical protein
VFLRRRCVIYKLGCIGQVKAYFFAVNGALSAGIDLGLSSGIVPPLSTSIPPLGD